MNRVVLFALALAALGLAPARAAALQIVLSEVLYDAVGIDDGRVFVELFGPPGAALSGLTLEGVNGANGAVSPVLLLSGSVPPDGFFVVADRSGGSTEVPNADLLLDFDFQKGHQTQAKTGP